MNIDKVTRFDADVALTQWDAMNPADLESGEPVQRGHFYYNDEEAGLMSGVWDCTPFVGKMGPYDVDEFMYLLEGSVTMELEDGSSTTVKAGESFIVPKGLVCKWIQTEYVKKFFVISSNESGPVHADPAQFGIITPKGSYAMQPIENVDPKMIIGAIPAQKRNDYYTDATGRFMVGIWHSEPFERPVFEFDHFDLMCIVSGTATVSDGAGDDQVFTAGEAVCVPKGAQYKWSNDVPVCKIFCAFLNK